MKFINPISILELIFQHKEWLDWEPETVWRDIDEMYPDLPKGQPSFPREFKDIIMAIRLCLANDMPWEQWNVFSQVVLAFSNVRLTFESYLKPSLAQVAFGVYVMNKIKVGEFSDEVAKFIACVAKESGMIVVPKVLEFAQDELDLLNYKIKDNVVKAKQAWELCKVTGKLPEGITDDNYIAVQCARLMAIDSYIKQREADYKNKSLVKLGTFWGAMKTSLPNISGPISSVGESAAAGYSGFTLSKDEAKDLAKYVMLPDKEMTIKAARDGIILYKYNTNFRVMDDNTIAEVVKKLTNKSVEEIGSIYKRLYETVTQNGYIVSPIARAAGQVGYLIGAAGNRLGSFVSHTILKRKEQQEEEK